MELDFTIDKYKKLCQTILDYEVLTFSDYLLRKDLPDKCIILRHDIDRKPGNALVIAETEKEFGIKASYYFRVRKGTFNTDIIRKIAEMGHEVGYHYESLDKAKGNYKKAIMIFQDELDDFRRICEARTICMHGNPLTRWDNRDLWSRYDFRDYGILGEASMSLSDKFHYFTDTSRTWNWRYRRKDRIENELGNDLKADTTNDIICLIKKGDISKIYITTHPERWSNDLFQWMRSLLSDMIMNSGKRIIYAIREI